ncbi:MAG: GGDEF domain-containing protein [Christensenellales bacterium]
MRRKLEAFLYWHLPSHAQSDNEKFLYLISFVASTYAVSMQLFVLLFYLITGILPLFYLYLCGFLIDISFFWLIKKRNYSLFGILLSGVVIVETLVSAVCVGTDNFIIVYLIVTLMMQIIIPYARTRFRILMSVVLGFSMIALVIINHHIINRQMTPIWNLGEANTTLAFFNVHLAFFGTFIQLTVGNFIWDVIWKANQEELKKSKSDANTDPLTGLFNRRYADTFFRKLIAGQLEQDWCVAMLDIDDFKLLNDTHGHQVGDGILMLISDFIKANLRRRDLVFRWGGEEFLILLKDVEVDTAFHILDKVRGKLELENLEIHDKAFKVTVTIGVCPLDIHHVEQSIDTCDRLMYKGKAAGKNRVVM